MGEKKDSYYLPDGYADSRPSKPSPCCKNCIKKGHTLDYCHLYYRKCPYDERNKEKPSPPDSKLVDEKDDKVSKWQQEYGEGFSMGMEAGLLVSIEFCMGVLEKLREERDKVE